jgi:hypothetical protein
MTESWLDIIPAIPLDRGVPVVNVATKARAGEELLLDYFDNVRDDDPELEEIRSW